ncbi:MAG: outer membrane protein assembly factor BamD [Desulfobulbaceae bacterium]|uniref:Outer membrane protein assembly factor BamD n=1 Tax=Candidatus Desulfatifera sulfidica TaxID=2841691 RepID=A0A8J6NBH7_9BACT|nr:outer membrane protein assembly factor BamD [Candidatus Desulfatifera sulfidica]
MRSTQTIHPSFSRTLLCAALLTLTLLGGCAKMEDMFTFTSKTQNVQETVDNLAIQGMDEYNVGKYFKARQHFTEILEKYPFSKQAMLAELKSADCNYFLGHYPEAQTLYQSFEQRYPTNEAIPYVMYQIGMCNYQRIDRIDRDTSGATSAIRDFSRLLRTFPDSPYTSDAQARIRAAHEFMSNHEYFVVQYYLRNNKLDQGVRRLKYIISTYPDAEITPRAQELLNQIEAGNAPQGGLSAWFSGLSLPNWQTWVPGK